MNEDMRTLLTGFSKYLQVLPKFRHLPKIQQDLFLESFERDFKLILECLKLLQEQDNKLTLGGERLG